MTLNATRTRPVIGGVHGAVASAHPLASQAGLDVLRGGGNAVDALVATAATLNVVEPYMSGVGGAGLMMLHLADGTTKSLNFSGTTPAAATPEQFTPEEQVLGPKACLIPGNVAGWLEALRAHGTKPAVELFQPAIGFAQGGFPLHPLNADLIERMFANLNPTGQEIYGKTERRVGAVLRQPELADTLAAIAEHGADYFYRGPLAEKITDHVQSQGGFLSRDDLANYKPEWTDPVSIHYRGVEVKTCPPNCEGFQILQTLKLLESTDLQSFGHNSADYIHLVSEAIKLATADRIRYCGDPAFHDVPVDRLLSDAYAATRRGLMNATNASHSEGERWRADAELDRVVPPGKFEGLTTHLSAIDAEGNVASITQSLGNAFGSGVAVPGTGVVLNNLLFWTEIDPTCPTPNLLQPGKRWSCPMAPVQVFGERGFWFSIGTPGSYGILQTTVQMLLNIIDFGGDPQTAIEAPRFRLFEKTHMQIENRIDPATRDALTSRGHALELIGDYSMYVGGGQCVMIDPDSSARLAGADPRRDGYALAY